jgi:hypothetical protein
VKLSPLRCPSLNVKICAMSSGQVCNGAMMNTCEAMSDVVVYIIQMSFNYILNPCHSDGRQLPKSY